MGESFMKVLNLGRGVFMFECPGCGMTHFMYTRFRNSSNAIWQFNGDIEKPTFHPSINYTAGYMIPRKLLRDDEYEYYKKKGFGSRCHSYLRNGIMTFLNDCTHDKKGQKIELPEITEQQIKSWQIYKQY
jgi:hypothetical protein